MDINLQVAGHEEDLDKFQIDTFQLGKFIMNVQRSIENVDLVE